MAIPGDGGKVTPKDIQVCWGFHEASIPANHLKNEDGT